MSDQKRNDDGAYYITTAIPYVNGPPHVGHAMEYVLADAHARYHRLRGRDVRYQAGADENSLKNVQGGTLKAWDGTKKGTRKAIDAVKKPFE